MGALRAGALDVVALGPLTNTAAVIARCGWVKARSSATSMQRRAGTALYCDVVHVQVVSLLE